MFFLSWRQLIARKKQTILILLGISFGTLLFITISGLQLGTREYISDRLLNNTAHVLITGAERMIDPKEVTEALYGPAAHVRWLLPPFGRREETRLENYQAWYQRLSTDPEVLDFAPRLTTNAILSNGIFTASVGLVGTVPDRHVQVTSIEKYISEGSFKALSGGMGNIVIGSKVAENLGARLDQFITVTTGKGIQRPFKVVGIVHFGSDQIDNAIAFAELTQVQILARSPGRISEIAVALFDIEKATEKAQQWKLIGTDKVQDWKEANKMFMEMINVQDYTRYFITFAILIVAAFGIYNVLSIMINQKKREIAILRAIGYGPRRILQLVLYQGIVLGIGGGLLGMVFGFFLCLLIGSIDLGIELGGSNNLQISYSPQIYITAFIAANLAALLASYLPVRAASRLTPMDILRAEQ
jgi:lipoprotein-releasing system permease protein